MFRTITSRLAFSVRQAEETVKPRIAYAQRSGRRIKEKVALMQAKRKEAGETGAPEKPGKFVLKTGKGTRDYGPAQSALRNSVLQTVTETFNRYGAETIDTPVFELRDVLMGKYGEEGGKLVYDLQDQGGELLSLRYDLTVPFARYLAMNKITNITRYQIAKVYRRDQPVMSRGRYREFYQCDFDIAGQYDLMLPEAECLGIVDELLTKLEIGEFFINLNHRLILEGMFAVSGIPAKDFKTICSSVDKLDKTPWEDVEQEMINEKFLTKEQTGKLGELVRFRELNSDLNNLELLEKMSQLPDLGQNDKFKKGAEELKVLIEYLNVDGVTTVRYEPSLARGLDYYTGAIYEAVAPKALEGTAVENSEDTAGQPVGVGSVAAGGRYDGLVKMFDSKANVPCCGVSFGIERLFAIMEARQKVAIRTTQTEVYVASAQKNLVRDRKKLVKMLRSAGIKTEMALKANPKLLTQFQYAEERRIPLAIVIGEQELKDGVVKLRNVVTRDEQTIKLDQLITAVRDTLAAL
ncbi:Histidine--tRNA ligase [Caenorhabditis elegans]|uniref:Histidine--tRNA ligase n=1 Tax=Caenorhabditis elegans TaxID=6239 RepID=SYH_CAEEL|nr:Histidine--tRNA ligase [Caenorhabditis elegans]P34183.3 RecName: Full=Histidine--tRNA ligase; AltName: Full=Histidyl-tRNA synthetase; Short=HisRS [Caenorhabditis elegans]CAD89746.1 Histidine--tRNA ligase [Caenorhabditis elegans]|eukprot:NP_001023374.1 Histidine--tRNA ligase [Caenorhabditis elegans]